jgi:hypothetical protein
MSKKNFCIALPQIASTIENYQRGGDYRPRFRALARMMVMERFCETTTLTADVPSSIGAIRCAVWAAVHFGYHAHHVSQSDGSGFVPIATARRRQRAFSGVSPPANFGL